MEFKQDFNNRIVLTDRKHLLVDGVEHVGNFNEKEISLVTNMGMLVLRGEGLHITQLNLESGNLAVEGRINTMEFTEHKGTGGFRGKGMLNRIFK
ncbi:sporulation protein YabP [Desulfallas thermosapovorans]|uniref:Sporulation protein YabP n=1 Tax=Desulfallas thermosapovorans DSM 6562 TaxID=1121431 RepID=A0A5S4ZVS9_9FIRM|nr:sporulation protein YabP [Desulfallas thermosapovorans]TYO96958.1 sporulation protein YabP [Desulfallas thermosapovorans DSM 6562]